MGNKKSIFLQLKVYFTTKDQIQQSVKGKIHNICIIGDFGL